MKIVEFAGISNRPMPGAKTELYLDTDTDLIYRWTGSAFKAIGPVITDSGLMGPDGAIPQPTAYNTRRIRRILDFYDGLDSSALTAAVNGSATSALDTTVGTSGKTAFGHRAWRLTTEAVNGSFAQVTARYVYTNYINNLASFDPALPLIVLIHPRSTNNGSRLKVWLAALDATDVGNTSIRADQYIPLVISGLQNHVVALHINMKGFASISSKLSETPTFLNQLRIQAFQEGTAGITDITILGVYQAQERPTLHIGFDDGLKSVYDNAFPILQERGLVASVAVMGADVGLTTGARTSYTNLPLMVKPELDELVAAGWEMTVHGGTGPSGMTYAQALELLQGQKAAVEALGYPESSHFYVYPGGAGNWTNDSDGDDIGPKALSAAGFEHARLLYGSDNGFSHAFNGLGVAAPLWQNKWGINPFAGPCNTIYETADYATKIKNFELSLQKLANDGGHMEVLTHNVVARSVFPTGQPYIADGYTGTVSVTNDTSTETLTAMMDMVAMYRDIGLIDVVLKRDWWAKVPKTIAQRRQMIKGITN